MLNDTQANDVMYDIMCLTEEDNNPMLNHLYELHKLRDKEVQECVEDSFVSDDDVVNYNRVMRMRHA